MLVVKWMNMKYSTHITLSLLLVGIFSGLAKAITVTGNLRNGQANEQLKLTLLSGHIPLIDETRKLVLDSQGHFQTNLTIHSAHFAYFSLNDQRLLLFLPAEGILDLTGDASDLSGSLHFQGQGSIENTFIQHHLSMDYENLWLNVPPQLQTDVAQLITWTNRQTSHSHAELEQVREKLSNDTYNILKDEVTYYYTNFIFYLDFTGKLDIPLAVRDSLIHERTEAEYPFVYSPKASEFVQTCSAYPTEKDPTRYSVLSTGT